MRQQGPCPCGRSSDAYTDYDDKFKCFSCGRVDWKDERHKKENKMTLSKQVIPYRGLSVKTQNVYGAFMEVQEDGTPHSFVMPWTEEAELHRLYADKKYYWSGLVSPGLFGRKAFNSGSARAVTITEGGIDAMSVYEILGWPAVSVRSAAAVKSDFKEDYEWLNSFEKIYLCFDNDEAGRQALQAAATMFDFNKLYCVRLDKFKDANEYLTEGAQDEFKRVWWNSRRFTPDNIISSYSEIDEILDAKPVEAHASYPFSRWQEMTYGMRPGEVILVKAMEGIGKTEVLRAIEYHNLKETDHNIGIIHLEESKTRAIKGLAGYELKMPVHLPDVTLDPAQVKDAYRRLTKRDDRLHIYSHFGSEDPDDILNGLRFMAGVCECRVIFLDHISMIVSGLETEDERKKLDYISTHVKMLAEQLGFTLVEVSHVNDQGLTRGSRNISKAADLVVSIKRDLITENEQDRNTTHFTIEKNRFTGLTGPAGAAYFNRETFVLTDAEATFGVPFAA